MTHAERTRLLLLAASAGTEATLRRALLDWAMEGVEADTPANPEKVAADGFRGVKVAPQLQTGLYGPETRQKRHSGGNLNPQPEEWR